MKINLHVKFKDLRKIDMDIDMGEWLSSRLIEDAKGGANTGKYYAWALSLFNHETIDLDQPDTRLLKDFIKEMKQPALFTAQLENKIDEIELAAKKRKSKTGNKEE